MKARLWLATTKARPCTRGPLMLQKLSGTAFTTMKYLAKDPTWMSAEDIGETLLATMDTEENFGEDRDEDLISSLAKVTFHLRRGRDETHRAFFTRWDNAMRKVKEHQVNLPAKYEGFLMINGLGLNDSEIKHCLNYTRGSIEPRDVRGWVRKHETKLQVSQVGLEKDKKGHGSAHNPKNATHYIVNNEETEDEHDEEIFAIEEALSELTGKSDGLHEEPDEIFAIEESEAAELLSTVLAKKKTYMQTLKAKKAKELGRGYAGSSGTGAQQQSKGKNGKFMHAGNGTVIFNRDGKQVRMTLEEVKKITKCSNCHKVGHWHRECPEKGVKDQHWLEMDSGEAFFCGLLDTEVIDQEQDVIEDLLGDHEHMIDESFDTSLHPDLPALSETATEPVSRGHDEGHRFEAVGGLEQQDLNHFGGPDFESLSDSRYDCIHEVMLSDTFGRGGPRHARPVHTICEDLCATIDTGCQRMAIGEDTLRKFTRSLPTPLQVTIEPQEHRFRSVNGTTTTTQVASIPVAVGEKGGFLRPAVFTGSHCRHAPFLISLPFLIFCKTTLVLDEHRGLSANFSRLGFEVPCHLGPSGALRIQLGNFSDEQMIRLARAQKEFTGKTEFEVLKTTLSCQGLGSRDGASHQEDSRGGAQQGLVHVVPGHAQAHVHDDAHQLSDGKAGQTSGSHDYGRQQTQTPDAGAITGGLGVGDCDRGTGVQLDEHHGGGGTSGKSDLRQGGKPANVPPRVTIPTDAMPKGGTKLHEAILEVFPPEALPVPVLHVDSRPTSSGPREEGPRQHPDGAQPDPSKDHSSEEQAEPTIEFQRSTEDATVGMPPPEDHQGREQRLSEHREVCGLRRDTREDHDGAGTIEAHRALGMSTTSAHSSGDEGVATLGSTGAQRGLGGAEPAVIQPGFEKVRRQAIRALEWAGQTWQDIMSLVQRPDQHDQWEVFQLAGAGHKGPVQRCAQLLNLTKKQAKVVSEVYNPQRFGARTSNHGLLEGSAFDIVLGNNILKPEVRHEVRDHLKTSRPGLVIVSPPCTLYSIMQNMNKHHYENPDKHAEYVRRQLEARVLLNFGVEVCETVANYGGSYLFEHPWTSKAWAEPRLRRLLEREETMIAKNDQCMFKLVSSRGIRHKKPTGWMTNHEGIARALNITCDGSHDHEHVLGSGPGGSKSVLAQEYPQELVDTVLKAYRSHLDEIYSVDQLVENLGKIKKLYHEVFAGEIESAGDAVAEPPHGGAEPPEEVQEGAGIEDGDTIKVGEDEYIRCLPREKPMSLHQLVRRAHCGLGHVSNDRLVRILTQARASEEAIKIARNLECSVCKQHQHVHPARRAAPPRELHANQILGVDTLWLPGLRPGGKLRMALNMVDWATRFQLVIPLKDHTPGSARRAVQQWTRIFGPPERIYVDLGKEFRGAFSEGMEIDSILMDPGSWANHGDADAEVNYRKSRENLQGDPVQDADGGDVQGLGSMARCGRRGQRHDQSTDYSTRAGTVLSSGC